ncbi:LuxR C-terminal-related transcriptional regulator [Paraburkholderia fynbosensis]|uniref:HTH-type transcriptional regulator MalT n=1 Tax=Paraburkholderia fynbosensis TaxID=1200993 RepID=A0A6J5G6R4_9BURK|nr:LuxR C-terminal-related transcriptional regulator [Paraburkholderia fynbosensis]CAB3794707.1 HTH-type transcriptional regulator MalT [Paraburkholderia fynbosensis]
MSLIQTKMIPPRIPSGYVRRVALLSQLDERPSRSVTVVTAPAGFGKTTLLAEWREVALKKKHPVAWLSLDEEDDDPQQFGAYLVAAFSRTSDSIAQQAQQLLDNDASTPIRTVISVLLNGIAAYGRSAFLVLDDVDRLNTDSVLATVSRLLRYAPENMHVLLGARGEPGLTLGQLRTPEKLIRIGADDLRFSMDDAREFFAQAGIVPLDQSSIELLNQATEGWVIGLQLVSLAAGQMGDATEIANNLAGTCSGIDHYLNDTVLAHLPPVMLKFLLYTSILDRLTAPVCDAIMGGEGGSGQKLEWLERHSVFIQPLDQTRDWYRCHVLLSDALRRRLVHQMPQKIAVLHQRACQWFAGARLWPEAVTHALAAGEFEQAAQWAEHCAMEMLERGDPCTLLGWIKKLPTDVLQRRLRLRLAKAWALALSLQTTRATREIDALVEEFNRGHRDDGDMNAEVAGVEISAIRALIASNSDDSERVLELVHVVETSTAPSAPWVKCYVQAAHFFGLMYRGEFGQIRRIWNVAEDRVEYCQGSGYSDMFRDAMYGLAALLHGELSEARQIFEETFERAENVLGASSAGANWLAGCLASIYYECNELPQAREIVAGRATLVLDAAPLGALVQHTLSVSRLKCRSGETDSALTVLEGSRQVAITRRWPRLRVACDAEIVKLLLEEGNVARASQIARELGLSLPKMWEGRTGAALETWTSYCLVRARVLIAEDLADKAVIFLTLLLDKLGAMGWRYSEAIVSLLLARAFEQCNASGDALAALDHALLVGEAIGMVNSFVDEGPPMRTLLQRFRRSSGNVSTSQMAYVDRLLAAFDELDNVPPASHEPVRPVTTSPDVLSAREFEIVRYVARGLSNKEIGRSLKLAPETVKWHLKNIFEKLNVGSRIEAVQSVLGSQGGRTECDQLER